MFEHRFIISSIIFRDDAEISILCRNMSFQNANNDRSRMHYLNSIIALEKLIHVDIQRTLTYINSVCSEICLLKSRTNLK